MIIVGLIVAVLVGTIGIFLTEDDSRLVRAMGRFLLMLAGGIGFTVGMLTTAPPGLLLDEDKCIQYVWLDEDWKCVPVEEAG